jgi:hypothetical protein
VVLDVLPDPRIVATSNDESQRGAGGRLWPRHPLNEEFEGSESEGDVLLPLVPAMEGGSEEGRGGWVDRFRETNITAGRGGR